MIKFNITQKDLGNLGYPMDMKREMYLHYHQWIKDGKNPLDFECEIERSLEYVESFLDASKSLIEARG